MGKREKAEFFNPELRLTKEEESERRRLEKELDKALSVELMSKKKQAECWAALRPLHSKPGCKGGWKKFVESKGPEFNLRTVNGLIKRLNDGWEESVKKPKKLSPNRANSARFTGLGLEFTGKPFLTDKEIEAGNAGKEILEAAFLLTPDEKDEFMEALRIIGPEKALDIMRSAVLDYRENMGERPSDDPQLLIPVGEPL